MSFQVSLCHQFSGFALDLNFNASENVTAVMGPSGSGKTTLAKMISGVMTPHKGRVSIGTTTLFDSDTGINLPPHKRKIGYVFQEPRLLPHLTVRQNLGYGAWFAGKLRPDLGPVSDMLGLGHLLDRMPRGLSGGEAQRVALGRALLCAPNLLILDEPLAALDAARKEEILPYLARIRDEAQCPILYITHAVSEVAQLANALVVLDNGRLAAIGPTAHVLADPKMTPTLGPRTTGAVLHGTIQAHADDGLSEVAVAGGRLFVANTPAPIGAPVSLRIEASEVLISVNKPDGLSALNILPGTITGLSTDPRGGILVQIDTGGDRILSKLTQRSATLLALRPGMNVHAVFKSVSVEISQRDPAPNNRL